MQAGATIRGLTPELGHLPWSTDILSADLPALCNALPDFKDLITLIDQEDRRPYTSTNYSELKAYLHRPSSHAGQVSDGAFGTVFRLKVVDTLNRVYLNAPMVKNECKRPPPVVLPALDSSLSINRLTNWATLVKDLNARLNNNLMEPEFTKELKASAASPNHCWTSLCATGSTSKLINILLNLEHAAFYLEYMIKGNIDLPQSFVDIHEDFKKDKIFLWKDGATKLGLLRIALFAALMLTPLSLLIPRRFCSKTIIRENFLQGWIKLAARPTGIVEQAELTVLHIVCDAATKKRPNIYQSLKEDLPRLVALIKTAEKEQLEWFSSILPIEPKKQRPARRKEKRKKITHPVTDESEDESASLSRRKRIRRWAPILDSNKEEEVGASSAAGGGQTSQLNNEDVYDPMTAEFNQLSVTSSSTFNANDNLLNFDFQEGDGGAAIQELPLTDDPEAGDGGRMDSASEDMEMDDREEHERRSEEEEEREARCRQEEERRQAEKLREEEHRQREEEHRREEEEKRRQQEEEHRWQEEEEEERCRQEEEEERRRQQEEEERRRQEEDKTAAAAAAATKPKPKPKPKSRTRKNAAEGANAKAFPERKPLQTYIKKIEDQMKKKRNPPSFVERANIELDFYDPTMDTPPFENPEGIGLDAKFKCNPASFPRPDGQGDFLFTPNFYSQGEAQRFGDLLAAAQATFVNGKPRYLSNPENSRVKIMTYQDYRTRPEEEIAKIFKSFHIVTINESTGELQDGDVAEPNELELKKFEQAVEELCDGCTDRGTTIHDLSKPVVGGNYTSRHTYGTPQDLIRAARSPTGKAANGLDNPVVGDDDRRQPLASEALAWTATVGRPLCKNSRYPTYPMRWGLIATGGCYHTMHEDSDGLATAVRPRCRAKLWFIGVPKDNGPFENFADSSTFDERFNIEGTNEHEFDIEAVMLLPGMRLIQRPNTPHSVYTPVPSVVKGCHFYAGATLRDTLYGVLHTFLKGASITNTDHRATSFELLYRLVAWYHGHYVEGKFGTRPGHIPNVLEFDGLLDLVLLSTVMVLSNVLNRWRNSDGIRPGRFQAIFARMRCNQIMQYVWSNHVIRDPDGSSIDGETKIFRKYQAQVANVLLYQARVAMEAAISDYEDKDGDDGIAKEEATQRQKFYEELEEGIVGSFYQDKVLMLEFENGWERDEVTTFAWVGPRYTVERIDGDITETEEQSGLLPSDLILGITDELLIDVAKAMCK